MANKLPQRSTPLTPYRFNRYFEAKNSKVRVFGKCEVTGKKYECFIPTDEFYVFLQADKTTNIAMPSVPKEDREFLISGTSPEGWKQIFP